MKLVKWYLYFTPIVLLSSPSGMRVPKARLFVKTLEDIEYEEYWKCYDQRGLIASSLLTTLLEIYEQHVFALRHDRDDISFVWRLAQAPLLPFYDRHFGTLDAYELSTMLHHLNYPNVNLVRCDLLFQWRSLMPGESRAKSGQ